MKHIFWTYDHPTARDQEMILFKSNESAVIPILGDTEHYEGYNNELNDNYPLWRDNVELQLNIVEKLRRNFSINPTIEIQELFNKYIDYIFINCEPEELEKLLNWYSGFVLFRCNGGPDSKNLHKQVNGWVRVINKLSASNRVFYLYGHPTLFKEIFDKSKIKSFFVPVYVDISRFKNLYYNPIYSNFSSAISYLDHHPLFIEHLENLNKCNLKKIKKFEIYGKNKKRSLNSKIEIIGKLPHFKMWKKLLSNKCFIDLGENVHHTIFPPLEAMFLGMPVIFCKNNGHVKALEKYFDKELSENYGVFKSLQNAIDFANKASLNELMQIHKLQKKIFQIYFDKDTARVNILNSIGVNNYLLNNNSKLNEKIILKNNLLIFSMKVFRFLFNKFILNKKVEYNLSKRLYIGKIPLAFLCELPPSTQYIEIIIQNNFFGKLLKNINIPLFCLANSKKLTNLVLSKKIELINSNKKNILIGHPLFLIFSMNINIQKYSD